MPAESVGVVASARIRVAKGNRHFRSYGTGGGTIACLTTLAGNPGVTTDRVVTGPGIFAPARCNVAGSRQAPGAPLEVFARGREFVPEDGQTFSIRLVRRGRRAEFQFDLCRPLAERFSIGRAFPGLACEDRRRR